MTGGLDKSRRHTSAKDTMTTVLSLLIITATLCVADNSRNWIDESTPPSQVRKFTRPSSTNGFGPVLPHSYQELGLNVRASKSYTHPLRRIGLADVENEYDMEDSLSTSSMGVTSQPDISSVMSASEKRKINMSDRISELRKKFPKFRNRNRYGSRNKESFYDDKQETSTKGSPHSPVEVFTRSSSFNPSTSRGLKSDVTLFSEITTTTANVRSTSAPRRPFRVKRPNRNQENRYMSNRQPPNNKFQQILNRRRANTQRPNEKSHFKTHDAAINRATPIVPFNKEILSSENDDFVTVSTGHNSKNPIWIDSEVTTTQIVKQPNEGAHTKNIQLNRATSFTSNQFQYSKPAAKNSDSSNDINNNRKRQRVNSSDIKDVNQKHLERRPFNRNIESEVHLNNNNHKYNSHMEPSSFDNGRDWYPNHPHDSNEVSQSEISYGQYERQDKPGNEKQNVRTSGDKNSYLVSATQSFSSQSNKNPNYKKELNNYDIPDLSLTSRDSARENIQEIQAIENFESGFGSHGNDRGQLAGYNKFSDSSLHGNDKPRKWAYDPKWVTSDDQSFHTSRDSTTETIYLMEPTRVPGSSHLVTRNEFPYNFWKPNNVDIQNTGIYPKNRQEGQTVDFPHFKEVPEHLFSVGAGPVSIPEELVRNTYEMVTAAPTFDLMSNPFGDGGTKFNSLPDVSELGSPLRANRRRVPPRGNKNRRPTQNRSNPFQSIMNFINPRPSQRPNPIRPSISQSNLVDVGKPRNRFPSNYNHGPDTNNQLNARTPHADASSPNKYLSPSEEIVSNTFNGAVGYTHFNKLNANRAKEDLAPNTKTEEHMHDSGEISYNNEEWKQNSHQIRPTNEPGSYESNLHKTFVPDRSRPRPAHYKNGPRRHRNRMRPNNSGSRFHKESRRNQRHKNKVNGFQVNEPSWVRDATKNFPPSENSVIAPVNPHSQYITVGPQEHGTSSHFDVKHYDINQSLGTADSYAVRLGGERNNFERPMNRLQNVQFGTDPREEQSLEPYIPPNHYIPQINYDRRNIRRPQHRHPNAVRTPNFRRPQITDNRGQPETESSQSLWSRITDFDFSFLNPFNQDGESEDNYGEDVDRVASGAVLSTSLLVPGGLAVLGAGLSLFYFNYGWLVQTPVVKARLVDMVMKGIHVSSLTDEQQRAIGDVTKVSNDYG